MIVLEASAAVTLLLSLPPAAAPLRQRLAASGETLHAPHVLDLEVMSTLRRYALHCGLSDATQAALADLADLRLTRYPHAPFADRIWELRENLTAYDAAYVALAEALGAPLVTKDARLANAPGIRATVELF